MSDTRVVSKTDFDAFLAAYPHPLARNVSGIFEPPILCYHDWTVGKEWDSVVASVVLNESWGQPNEYRIHGVKAAPRGTGEHA